MAGRISETFAPEIIDKNLSPIAVRITGDIWVVDNSWQIVVYEMSVYTIGIDQH